MAENAVPDEQAAESSRSYAQREGQSMVPFPVRAAAAWSWRIVAITAASVLVGYLLITFKTVVVAFIVAILLAVLLHPMAKWLRRYLRFPKALASITSILVMLAVVVGLLVLSGRSIIAGFSSLADQAIAGFNELVDWLSGGPLGIDREQIEQWISDAVDTIEQNMGVLASGVLEATSSVTQIVSGALISAFCLFFFLKDGRQIWQWFVRLAPRAAREGMNEAGIRAWLTLGGYARTQIIVALVDAAGIGAGAALLGVPLALPLAVLVFLSSFIPIVGALVSGAVAVLVALVAQGPLMALLMLGVVLFVQQAESNLLQPWLMGHAVSLHPVAVLLAVAGGTGIAGILGALLAVPIAAVVNTVVLYLNGHDKHPKLATDWHRPGGPPGSLSRAIADSYRGKSSGAAVAAESGGAGARPADNTDDEGAEGEDKHG